MSHAHLYTHMCTHTCTDANTSISHPHAHMHICYIPFELGCSSMIANHHILFVLFLLPLHILLTDQLLVHEGLVTKSVWNALLCCIIQEKVFCFNLKLFRFLIEKPIWIYEHTRKKNHFVGTKTNNKCLLYIWRGRK